MNYAKEFLSLFDGLRRAYGIYDVKGARERDGKNVGKVTNIQKELTLDVWNQHLSGVQSIGIIPIQDDSTCNFGAIDIDDYQADLAALAKKIDELKLPLVPTRTKSGGLHAWLFLSSPAPAALVQRKLRDMAAALGYGRAEIFPKQSEVLTDRGDIGSWINMPYFNSNETKRYGLKLDGSAMSVDEFLAAAKATRISVIDLASFSFTVKEELDQGPPCLQFLVQQGFQQGTRNAGLYNLGVYAKKAFPDVWEQMVEKYNIKYMDPPLASNEVKELIKSLKKKDYQYTCNQAPIIAFCNAAVCRGKKFGVGDHSGMPVITGLTKFCSNPPIWFADVEGGGRLELLTEDLQNQIRFQRRCMDTLNMMPSPMNNKAWQVMIQALMDSLTLIEAPIDATPRGQLSEMVEKFCTQRAQALSKDEIRLGKPFKENGRHYFTTHALMAFLERHKFKEFRLHEITSYLKNHMCAEHHFFNVRGKGVNCWSLPEFGAFESELPVPEKIKGGSPF